jgi:hypothetical protein
MSHPDPAHADTEAITAALNLVYPDVDAEPDSSLRTAAVETLRRVEWDESDDAGVRTNGSPGDGS